MSAPSFDLSKTRHELRTPINHIIGYCEMLLEEERLPERFYQDLRNIHASGRRLLELIAHHFDERTVGDPKNLQELQHELRTPVNHIIGYSELLEDHAAEVGLDRLAPDLHRIRDAARDWLTLMEELLIPSEVVQDPNFAQSLARPPMLALATPGIAFHTVRPRLADEPAHWQAHILVVDDDPANRDLLTRRLRRYGATVATADDGLHALQMLRREPFDLALLDLLMPGLDGYQVLTKMKADAKLRDIPVIMISGLDQENGIARCLEAGAEDYLTKPFNSVFLKARIGACLEKKRWRDQERATHNALVKSQQRLASELAAGAAYVRSLLPAPMEERVKVRWRFQPSAELGGDCFGYHWLANDKLAVYLLDVSGHGMGAALLSVSVLNVIRAESLAGADFCDPASVLRHLNRVFQMDKQNNLIFTIWYGVFDTATRQITFASGGHPPAVLLEPAEGNSLRTRELSTHGKMLGIDPAVEFRSDCCPVPRGSRLYVFSDGAYEIPGPDGRTRQLPDFIQEVGRPAEEGTSKLDSLVNWAQNAQGHGTLEDDLSLMELEL
jgi:phosphoserine phosphatase RsbU/P